MPRLWPVAIDAQAWAIDLRAASPTAREHAITWWAQTHKRGGIPHDHLHSCPAEHASGLHLPNCVKVRLPDPHNADAHTSPWGVVLWANATAADRVTLQFLAFGLHHPETLAGTRPPSVYERAHRRLNARP